MFGYEFSPSHRNAGLPSSGEDAADDKEEQARVGDERQDNVDATRGNGVGVGDAENREDEAEDGVEHGEQNAADDDGGLDRVARLGGLYVKGERRSHCKRRPRGDTRTAERSVCPCTDR